MARSTPKSVSLAFELANAVDVLRTIRLAGELLREPWDPGQARERMEAAEGLLACLDLLSARMKQVVGAIRGDHDPAVLLMAENVVDPAFYDFEDLLLQPWSDQRAAREASETVERLRKKANHGRKRKERRP